MARGDGVIRDAKIHRQVLLDVLTFAQAEGFSVRGLIGLRCWDRKGMPNFSLGWDLINGKIFSN